MQSHVFKVVLGVGQSKDNEKLNNSETEKSQRKN